MGVEVVHVDRWAVAVELHAVLFVSEDGGRLSVMYVDQVEARPCSKRMEEPCLSLIGDRKTRVSEAWCIELSRVE